MDFRQDWMTEGRVPLPFYMTYPGYLGAMQESALLRDMEYLRQTCPGEVRRMQRRITEILDKMDYEGSMIYDEYPDRSSLMRLADSITVILRREDAQRADETEQKARSDEYWSWVRDLVQVLLCDEIYMRRHGNQRRSIYLG